MLLLHVLYQLPNQRAIQCNLCLSCSLYDHLAFAHTNDGVVAPKPADDTMQWDQRLASAMEAVWCLDVLIGIGIEAGEAVRAEWLLHYER